MTTQAEKLRERHAKELAQAQFEDQLITELEKRGAGIPSLFHHTRLYGVAVAWSYGDSYRHDGKLTIEQCQTITDE